MQYPVHHFEVLAGLSPEEIAVLQQLGDPPAHYKRGETIRRKGDRVRGIYLHLSGWIASQTGAFPSVRHNWRRPVASNPERSAHIAAVSVFARAGCGSMLLRDRRTLCYRLALNDGI